VTTQVDSWQDRQDLGKPGEAADKIGVLSRVGGGGLRSVEAWNIRGAIEEAGESVHGADGVLAGG